MGSVDLTERFEVPAELVHATDKATIRKLSVGAGAKDKDEGYVTVDIAGDPDVLWDITESPWPFPDEHFRFVKAHHILEHIPRDTFHFVWTPLQDEREFGVFDNGNGVAAYQEMGVIRAGSRSYFEKRKGFVTVMNEMWRVLEPDGRCWLELPVFPTEDAVADPTHSMPFTSSTFDYLVKDGEHEEHRALYGLKPWAIQRREKLNYGRTLYVLLRKVPE